MRIVHLAGVVEHKPKAPTTREKQLASARKWAQVQSHKRYREFLVEFADRIKAVQDRIPGWMPEREVIK